MAVIFSALRDRSVVTDLLWQKLDIFYLDDIWFYQIVQHAIPSRGTINLLREKFNDHVVSKTAYVSLPQRSSDTTLFDFLLWSCIGWLLYPYKPRILNDLKKVAKIWL